MLTVPGARLAALFLMALAGCADPTSSVRYAFTWDETNVTREADALRFQTNLGFDVTLIEARVHTYSASLVPCDPLARDGSLLFPRIARAGHGDESDPSAVGPLDEDLLNTSRQTLSATSLEASYCRVHYLVARDDTGRSLSVVGAATRGDDSYPIAIETDLATGTLRDLPLRATNDVLIERRLSTLFDDVEFAAPTEAMERTVLRNLTTDTVISLEN